MKNKFFKWLGYLAYSLVLFLILIYYNFPYNLVAEKISDIGKQATNKYIYIQEFSPRLPTGANLKNIVVKESIKESGITIFSAKEINAKLNLTSLFLAEKVVNFDIRAYGGNASGKVGVDKNNIKVNVDFENLQVNRYPLHKLIKVITNPLQASLTGKITSDFTIKGKTIEKGNLSLNLKNGKIEKINIYSFSLPAIQYNKVDGKINFEKGKINLKKLHFKGKDIELELNGNITLNKVLVNSRINLEMRYKVSSVFKDMETIAMGMSGIKLKKDSKGFSKGKIIGTFRKPRIR